MEYRSFYTMRKTFSNAPSYKAALENGKGIKLSSGKQKKLEALNAGKLETLKQCILENKMEIEQEMLI